MNEKIKNSLPKYFTSRFELSYSKAKGASSVYDKLERLRLLLNSTNQQEADEVLKKFKPVDGIRDIKTEPQNFIGRG